MYGTSCDVRMIYVLQIPNHTLRSQNITNTLTFINWWNSDPILYALFSRTEISVEVHSISVYLLRYYFEEF